MKIHSKLFPNCNLRSVDKLLISFWGPARNGFDYLYSGLELAFQIVFLINYKRFFFFQWIFNYFWIPTTNSSQQNIISYYYYCKYLDVKPPLNLSRKKYLYCTTEPRMTPLFSNYFSMTLWFNYNYYTTKYYITTINYIYTLQFSILSAYYYYIGKKW